MEIVTISVVEAVETVTINVTEGFGSITNSDATYNATVNVSETLVLPDITHTDTDGTPTILPAQTPMVCTPAACSGVDVENSDNTYSQHVNDGDTLVLPDTVVKNTAGATVLTQPSATSTGVIADSVVTNSDNTFSLNVPAETNPVLADIQFTDSDGSISNVPACKDVVATPATQTYYAAPLNKTGQTTSYRTGDDGDIEAGKLVDFFTLGANNPFGNTNRFTDELGGSTYTNNIVIDWSTFGGNTVLGYYRNYLGNATWDDQIDACLALSIGTFVSGWRLWNMLECLNVLNANFPTNFNYAPLNISGFGGYCHTSTNSSNYAIKIAPQAVGFYMDLDAKANAAKGVAVRTFTVSGTTLT